MTNRSSYFRAGPKALMNLRDRAGDGTVWTGTWQKPRRPGTPREKPAKGGSLKRDSRILYLSISLSPLVSVCP
jgi:hypothetical protein